MLIFDRGRLIFRRTSNSGVEARGMDFHRSASSEIAKATYERGRVR